MTDGSLFGCTPISCDGGVFRYSLSRKEISGPISPHLPCRVGPAVHCSFESRPRGPLPSAGERETNPALGAGHIVFLLWILFSNQVFAWLAAVVKGGTGRVLDECLPPFSTPHVKRPHDRMHLPS